MKRYKKLMDEAQRFRLEALRRWECGCNDWQYWQAMAEKLETTARGLPLS